MNAEWKNLRAFDGDVKKAFEELICQLANNESIPGRIKFTRVAPPDAGVEALCSLDNTEIYGWQAKYFTSLKEPQWRDIEQSFKTAFKKYPKLARYYVCIPQDLSSPKDPKRNFTLDVWYKKVEEWTRFCLQKKRKVEFIYWGDHEIFNRLARKENEGKRAFWFNQEEFTTTWFDTRLELSINNLGKRYTPQFIPALNVPLPIASVFNGLSRGELFEKDCKSAFDLFINESRVRLTDFPTQVISNVESIAQLREELIQAYNAVDFRIVSQRDWEVFYTISESIHKEASIAISYIERNKPDRAEKKKAKSKEKDYRQAAHDLEKVLHSASAFLQFIKSPTVELSHNPTLVITGAAGVGKSHLLADVGNFRKAIALPTILILGQHLQGEPWPQIITSLQTNLLRDKFLGALDALGQAKRSRVLIFIDAINEGAGKRLWPDSLPGFLTSLKPYKHIGLVVTIRSSYEKLIITSELKTHFKPVVVTHAGFANHEYNAARIFFSAYNIKLPSIPLLHPEFSNPLFLKLFCEGLHNKGLTEMPAGYEGITKILDHFLSSINDKLSIKHEIPRALNVVQAVVRQFAAFSAKTDNVVPYKDGFKCITNLLASYHVSQSSEFFNELISEGVITENLVWKEEKYTECIYLAYERFADHLLCEYYLDSVAARENLESLFKSAGDLYPFVHSSQSLRFNRGLVDALAIQLPERFGRELFQLVTPEEHDADLLDSIIESIPWRAKATLNDSIWQYIKTNIGSNKYRLEYFIHTALLVSTIPQHYFNGNFLHSFLNTLSMPDRDSWWNGAISHKYHYNEPHIIRRLVDWAWDLKEDVKLSDETTLLAAQTISWFLSSSDNGLRDAATKALVNLLTPRVSALISLLRSFENVNDPYIDQRLYAVAYGCVMRNATDDAALKIGQFVAGAFFSKEQIPADILTRDYARNIVEYACQKGFTCDNNFRPPYNSKWITHELAVEDLKDKYQDIAFNYLYSSVVAADFATYTLHAGKNHSDWSGLRFNEVKKTRTTLYNEFLTHLTGKQKSLWKKLDPLVGRHMPLSRSEKNVKSEIQFRIKIVTGRKSDLHIAQANEAFEKSLATDQLEFYLKEVKPYIDHNRHIIDNIKTFDMRIAQKFILNRVLELGWTPAKHGEFDELIGHPLGNDRQPRIIERIGKKYQWIAYYEFLGRVADNFQFKEGEYQGTWEPFLRDIDPSTIARKSESEDLKSFWWTPKPYSNWQFPPSKWVGKKDDLVNTENLICRTDDNGTEWLVLEGNYSWHEPLGVGQERYAEPQKDVWHHLRSYITMDSDLQHILKKLVGKNFMNEWMPSSNSRYEVFSREYYWAPSCDYYRQEAYPEYDWSIITNEDETDLIGSAFITTAEYSWDKDPLRYHLPSAIIFSLMNLRHGSIDGQMVNESNEVVCFDPSATHPSSSCLLIRSKDFIDMLLANGLAIFWTILSKKEVISSAQIFHELSASNVVEISKNRFKNHPTFFKDSRLE